MVFKKKNKNEIKDPKLEEDKNLSKKELKLKKEEQEFYAKVKKTETEQRITIILLDLLIKAVEKDVENFVPSIGTKSISQIDKQAKDMFEKLYNSKEVLAMFKDKERKTEMKPILDDLRSNKPTKWSTDAYFGYNAVKGKATAIRQMDENKELISKIENLFKWN